MFYWLFCPKCNFLIKLYGFQGGVTLDLKNFETTTTYAVQAVYSEYWKMIPEKYRLLEKAQVEQNPEDVKPKKSTPLSYTDVEKQEYKNNDYYEHYCEMMNSGNWFDVYPFYDPQLDFENRLHYKLSNIDYPDRKKPWFIITWNFGNGLIKSELTRRRFQTCVDKTPGGEDVTFKFINTDLEITLAIYSNTLQGLVELHENIVVGQREKYTVDTHTHSIIGKFPVSVDTITGNINKLPRDKGTLCNLALNLRVDYPIIGDVKKVSSGIIKEIHTELDAVQDIPRTVTSDTDVTAHQVISRDIVK